MAEVWKEKFEGIDKNPQGRKLLMGRM